MAVTEKQNMNLQNLPVVAGVEIGVDSEGRYNLNALHRASGGDPVNAPGQWSRLQKTKKLVDRYAEKHIGENVINIVKGGVDQGTFVTELLAIDYAAWISTDFRIQVYEGFQAYKNGTLQQKTLSRLEILEMALESEKEVLRLQEKVQVQQQVMIEAASEIEAMDAYRAVADADGTVSLADVIKAMGLERNKTYELLRTVGVLQKKNTIPYQQYVPKYFSVRVHKINGKNVSSTHVTADGINFLYRKLEEAKRVQQPIDIELLIRRLRGTE